MSTVAIELPNIPKDKDYEEYVCAYLQAGGLYVEKNIIHREVEEILELDVLTTLFNTDSIFNNLIEIKSGNWGFHDIFKIKGWLVFLNFSHGCFIVQKTRPSFSYFTDKAKLLGIKLIDNSDLSNTEKVLKQFLPINPDIKDIETLRFSYLLERKQLQKIKNAKKNSPNIKGYFELDDYFHKVNSGSFFSRDPIKRINQLFQYYIKHKNISAKLCNELNGGNYDDNEVNQLLTKCYKETFYQANDNIIQVSLFVEHLARITILKCSIEHLIDKLQGNYDKDDFVAELDYLVMPNTIKSGLNQIIKDKYFHLYPCFWQCFTYLMGGFILTEFEDKEYQILSSRTGIPINEIPNAFDSFNKLFPRADGWLYKFPSSNIKWHYLFPVSFSGIGANFRRMSYSDDETFDSLSKIVSHNMTMRDLYKWNNLSYQILK